MKVVALSGSHRRNGNTELALRIMAEKLNEFGVETEIIPLAGKKIENCRACESCRKLRRCVIEDALPPVLKKMQTADGIVLASPVYSFGITPLMSALIVRGNRILHLAAAHDPGEETIFRYPHPSTLRGKVGAALTVARRAGGAATLNTLNSFMLVNEMYVVGSSYENSLFGYAAGTIFQDTEGINNLHMLAENMGRLLQALASN